MLAVLDASAMLALLQGEPGSERVADALAEGCAISVVNVAEVLSKLAEGGADPAEAGDRIEDLADVLVVHPLDQRDVVEVARLRPTTRAAGLSLGDRACLALARRLGLPALTTDRAWAALELDAVRVELVR
ncbi:MAG TPA: type II toxin-antitoxin system VapC family toxin [Solirubrobacterales bacterium]|nr:type II toxin-antitoxin system VapC family toxin [Solirubrobacterales bacterium]